MGQLFSRLSRLFRKRDRAPVEEPCAKRQRLGPDAPSTSQAPEECRDISVVEESVVQSPDYHRAGVTQFLAGRAKAIPLPDGSVQYMETAAWERFQRDHAHRLRMREMDQLALELDRLEQEEVEEQLHRQRASTSRDPHGASSSRAADVDTDDDPEEDPDEDPEEDLGEYPRGESDEDDDEESEGFQFPEDLGEPSDSAEPDDPYPLGYRPDPEDFDPWDF